MTLKNTKKILSLGLFFMIFTAVACNIPAQNIDSSQKISVGAEQTSEYFPLLEGKKVGLVGNHHAPARHHAA